MTQLKQQLLGAIALSMVLHIALAQDSSWLLGTWQGSSEGVTYLTTLYPDGTYTFEALGNNYFEDGTWQFDGRYFSQQWQDPQSGQAMQETYVLEFLSSESFIQSGGNFLGPITFFKITEPELINAALTPRNYTCSTVSVMTTTTYTYNMNLGMVPMTIPVYVPSPSVIGTLTLDEQGNYFSSGLNERGNYFLDSQTKQLSFTGVLASLNPSYDGQTLTFTYSSDEGTQNHTCTHQ